MPSGPRRLRIIGALALLAALVASGAARSETAIGSLPATFLGTLPCADCAGIRIQINLMPDGAYAQRKTFLREGRDESLYEIGAWVLSGTRLELNGGGDARNVWSVVDPRTLRAGDAAAARLPSDLVRCAEILPMEPRVRMRGLYRDTPAGGRFSDCLSGLQWPVSREGGLADLEQAYRRLPKKRANMDLLVTIEGRVDVTPWVTRRHEPELIVERFLRASPGAICMEAPPPTELADTRWRPILLGGRPVALADARRGPWIELDSRRSRFTGSAGCNRVSGAYQDSRDGRLRFTGILTTRMACPSMATEETFLDALERTRRYRVRGRHLELLGADGAMLARLEERHED